MLPPAKGWPLSGMQIVRVGAIGFSLPICEIIEVEAAVGAVHGFSALDAVRGARPAVAVEHALRVGLARAVPTTGDAVLFAFFVKCCILDTKVVAQELKICSE